MDDRTRLSRPFTAGHSRNRPVNPPLERATTLLMPNAAAMREPGGEPTYGIEGLSSHGALREALAVLESAERVALTSSGLAAVAIGILAAVNAGDEVLAVDCVYGPTRRLLTR